MMTAAAADPPMMEYSASGCRPSDFDVDAIAARLGVAETGTPSIGSMLWVSSVALLVYVADMMICEVDSGSTVAIDARELEIVLVRVFGRRCLVLEVVSRSSSIVITAGLVRVVVASASRCLLL